MDRKRWLMATAGAFGVIVAAEYVIHNLWLGAVYAQTAQFWNPVEVMQARMGFLVGGQLAAAGLLAFVHARGYQPGKGTISQGFRFGILVGLLLTLPRALVQYAVYPYPASLILDWLLGGFVTVVLTGLILGFLYKPAR